MPEVKLRDTKHTVGVFLFDTLTINTFRMPQGKLRTSNLEKKNYFDLVLAGHK